MEREYLSSEKDFVEFTKSSIWKDMEAELGRWIEDINNELGDPENPRDVDMRLKGNKETCKKVLGMPFIIAENIKEDNIGSEEEEDDD